MSEIIIGLCGCEGSGKDTVADILVSQFNFVKLSFASILKDTTAVIFDWDRNLLEGSTKESREWREQIDEWWSRELNILDFTPRKALQIIGTDVMREKFHSDIWMICLKRKIQQYNKVVITDCRFPNEIDFLNNICTNFKLIHVKRNIPPYYELYRNYQINQVDNVHPSKYMWMRLNYYYEIDNTKDLHSLLTSVFMLVNQLNQLSQLNKLHQLHQLNQLNQLK